MLFTSPILSGASGSVAGLTASHNRGGSYFRARAVPTDPATGFQVAIRTCFGNLAARWQTLTPEQRQAWTTYAINVPTVNALGQPLTLTGQQMYVRCNTPRHQVGAPVLDDGPINFALDTLSPIQTSVSAAANQITIAFDDSDEWVGEDGAFLIAYASRQKGPAINFFKGPYRLAGRINGSGTTPPTSPDTSLTSPFEANEDNFTFARFFTSRADARLSAVQFTGPDIIAA